MFGSPKKLLFVEEDLSSLDILSKRWIALGYCVRAAESGSSALSEIEKELPDVLIASFNMSNTSNAEFLSIVRRRFPSVRVVAMGDASRAGCLPPGIAADAFCEEGSSLHLVTEAVDAMTRPGRSTIRLATEDLFGFQVFENIPFRPATGQSSGLAEHSIAFLVPRYSCGLERVQGREERTIEHSGME